MIAPEIAIAPLRARKHKSEPVITNEAEGFERAVRYLKRHAKKGKTWDDAILELIERGRILRLMADLVNQ